jgi:hypothetical protein
MGCGAERIELSSAAIHIGDVETTSRRPIPGSTAASPTSLGGFSDAPEALTCADSIMGSFAAARALIIDLGENRGGWPAMVRLLSTYFFDRPTHLVSTAIRGMPAPREPWTLDRGRGTRLPRVPLYPLTSRRTISAAESFISACGSTGERPSWASRPTAAGTSGNS